MSIYQLGEYAPEIDASSFVADTATVIGKVTLHANTSVWFGATIRGDNERITVGAGSNVQEGTVMHTDMGYPLTVGENVTIGHQAMLHGCTIGDGALVTEGKEFPDNSLIIGSPAKAVRTLTEQDAANMRANAENYVQRGQLFKSQLKKIGTP